jgi:hypothetical protein
MAAKKATKKLTKGKKVQAKKTLFSFGASNPANVGGQGLR